MQEGFRKLTVWQKAYELVLEVYKITKRFPVEEQYGLISQIRRSVISIPANIAEGYSRRHRKEYVQFLYIAKGSLAEVETFLMISRDLGYISHKQFEGLDNLRQEVAKMLYGLIRSLL